ncbi:MAG: fibronectin type III domain-containing protein, partial [Bacteroidota bacterium]
MVVGEDFMYDPESGDRSSESPDGHDSTPRNPLKKVDNLTATLTNASIYGDNRILLSWDKSSIIETEFDHYNIYRREESESSFSNIQQIQNQNTTSYTDSGLEYDETYYYKITAVDIYKNETDLDSSDEIMQTTRTADTPSTPLFSDNSFFKEEIYLEWSESADAIKYEVRLDSNFGVNDNNLVYKGDGLNCKFENPTDRSHTFYVKALNDNNRY